MDQQLPLVIARTTAVEVAAEEQRLKRRRAPLIERLDGLYVVMSIHQHGRQFRTPNPLAVDQRMTRSPNEAHVLETGLEHPGSEPACAGRDLGRLPRLRA